MSIRPKTLSTNQWTFFIFFCVGLLSISLSEKVPVADGLGWDGANYGAMVKNFSHGIFVKNWDTYEVTRSLPSLMVYLGLSLFHVPIENPAIIRGFEVYNLLLLLIACYVWGLITSELKLSDRGKWLAFCSLFLNFAILKHNFYYPVITDTSGFALGIFAFYFYLRNHPLGLLTVIIAGVFCWPPIAPFSLILFLFPNNTPIKVTSGQKNRINLIIPLSACSILLAGIISAHFIKHFYGYLPAVDSVLNLSITIVLLYVFFSFYYLVRDVRIFDGYILRAIDTKRTVIVLPVFILLKIIVDYLSSGPSLKLGYLLERTVVISIQKPFIFEVAHVVFLGPIVLLTAFLWKPFCQRIYQHGVGLFLLIALATGFSITSQSRQLLSLFPIFVGFTVQVIDSLNWKNSQYWFFIIVSLFYSKVWLSFLGDGPPINAGRSSITLFPDQYYLMSIGDAMSDSMYAAQGGIILFTALLFFVVLFGGSEKEDGKKVAL